MDPTSQEQNQSTENVAFTDTAPDAAASNKKSGFFSKFNMQQWAFIGVSVLAIGLIGFGVYAMVGGPKSDNDVVGRALFNLFDSPPSSADYEFKLRGNEDDLEMDFDISGNVQLDIDAEAFAGTTNAVFRTLKDTGFDASGLELGFELRAVGDTAYFRVTDIDKLTDLVDSFIASQGSLAADERQLLDQIIDAVVNNVNNQWIEIESDDAAVADATCIDEFELSKDDRKAIIDTYEQNPLFEVIEQVEAVDINGVNAVGYKVEPNDSNAENFIADLRDQDFVGELEDCLDQLGIDLDEEFEGLEDESADLEATEELVFYIDDNNQIQRIELTAEQTEDEQLEGGLRIDFGYGEVDITAPEDTKSFQEVCTNTFNDLPEDYAFYGAFICGSFDSTGFGDTSSFGSTTNSADDGERQSDILALHSSLEVYYANNGYYPGTLLELVTVDPQALVDPDGSQYSYIATTDDGFSFCFTGSGDCSNFKVSAILSDGTEFAKEDVTDRGTSVSF